MEYDSKVKVTDEAMEEECNELLFKATIICFLNASATYS